MPDGANTISAPIACTPSLRANTARCSSIIASLLSPAASRARTSLARRHAWFEIELAVEEEKLSASDRGAGRQP